MRTGRKEEQDDVNGPLDVNATPDVQPRKKTSRKKPIV